MSGPARKKDRFNRFAWRDAVFADPETSANAKCLAFAIAKHVSGETGEAFPSTMTLAEECGMSEKWVRNTIPELQSPAGWSSNVAVEGAGISTATDTGSTEKSVHSVRF